MNDQKPAAAAGSGYAGPAGSDFDSWYWQSAWGKHFGWEHPDGVRNEMHRSAAAWNAALDHAAERLNRIMGGDGIWQHEVEDELAKMKHPNSGLEARKEKV